MRKKFSNKFNAFQNIYGVFMDWRASYENIPIMKQLADEFLSMFESVKQQIKKVDLSFQEVTEEKVRIKRKLAEVGSGLASAGMVYAYDIEDPELKSFLNFSMSDIFNVRDAEAVEISRHIAEELMKYREELANYLISEEELQDYQTLIARFEKLQVKRETVQSESVIETQRLEVLFDMTDTLLREKIDRLVRKMKLTDLEFYNQYFQARRIHDF